MASRWGPDGRFRVGRPFTLAEPTASGHDRGIGSANVKRALGERDNRYTMETALVLLTPEYALPYTRGAPRKYETSPTPRFVALRGRWSRWWKQFFNTTFSYLERTLNSTSSNGLRLYEYALFPDDAYWPKILKQ